jgi:septal ring factor EnvC (AmiA/AmiB activator)
MTGPASLKGGEAAECDLVRENRDLNTQVRKLETQIGALTRRLTEQESVLLELRKNIDAARSTKTRNDSRPSP